MNNIYDILLKIKQVCFADFFVKIKFYLFRPKAVFIFGKNKKNTGEIISRMLNRYFRLWEKIFIFELDFANLKSFEFFIKNSSLPILIFPDFKKDNIKEIKRIINKFTVRGKIILNNDAEGFLGLKEEIDFSGLTFGLKSNVDFHASDIKTNGETNFKLNHEGSSVPVWMEDNSGKDLVYAALSAFAVGSVLGLNLVEISQSLKIKNH